MSGLYETLFVVGLDVFESSVGLSALPGSEAIRLPFTGRIDAPYVMTVVYQHLLVVFCPPGYAIGKAHHRYVLVFVPKRKVYSLGNTPRFACGYFVCIILAVVEPCHELVGRGEFRHFRRRGSDFPAFSCVYIYDEQIFGSRVVPLARDVFLRRVFHQCPFAVPSVRCLDFVKSGSGEQLLVEVIVCQIDHYRK